MNFNYNIIQSTNPHILIWFACRAIHLLLVLCAGFVHVLATVKGMRYLGRRLLWRDSLQGEALCGVHILEGVALMARGVSGRRPS